MKSAAIRLGEVVSISKGRKHDQVLTEPTHAARRFIQIDDLRNDNNLKYTEEKGVEVKANDIIIAWDGANAGTIGFGLEGNIGSTLARLRIERSDITSQYLGWLLRSKFRYLRDHCTGATIPHISKQVLEGIQVPVHPLSEQQKIAAILSQVDAAREKRKQANQLTEQFLQSTFLSLFGDPVRNEKGWEECKAIDVCDCIVPGRDKPKSFSGDIPWVTTDDLIDLGITEKSKKNIGLSNIEIKEVRARIIPSGSVLITCVGDLGVVSIAATEMVVNQQLHAFQCQASVNNVFLMFCLKLQTDWMYKMASATTVPYMNKTTCNSIPIFLPPLSLQQKFADIVQQAEQLRSKQRQSEQELEQLFQSLLQRYFG